MADQVQQALKALKNQFIFNPIPYGAAQVNVSDNILVYDSTHRTQQDLNYIYLKDLNCLQFKSYFQLKSFLPL